MGIEQIGIELRALRWSFVAFIVAQRATTAPYV